ncbi:MAG: hypothetical protein AB9842_02650 [Bacteroidales bacterium]
MNKKVRLIIIIVAVLGVAILIFSYFYPPSQGDDASGTIGKAEKFRKGLFTEDDILLRDDILEDTAAVGKTLDQILAFTSFMQQQKIIIDTLWIAEIKKNCPPYQGCLECPNCDKAVALLQDYSDFLKNNNETIKSTIDILIAAYNGKSKEYTFDVGVRILGFVQFMDESIKRDSVLTTAIRLVDQFITKEKVTDKKRQAALNKLKQVRDKMIIDNLLFAMKTGDKKQADMVASMPLGSAGDNISNIVLSSGYPEAAAAETIGNIVANTPIGVATMDAVQLGSYSEGRYSSAVYGSTYVAVSDNVVYRQVDNIANAIGVSAVANITVGSAGIGLAEVIGVGYSNVVGSAPLGVFGSSTGTIFNSDNIGLIVGNE